MGDPISVAAIAEGMEALREMKREQPSFQFATRATVSDLLAPVEFAIDVAGGTLSLYVNVGRGAVVTRVPIDAMDLRMLRDLFDSAIKARGWETGR